MVEEGKGRSEFRVGGIAMFEEERSWFEGDTVWIRERIMGPCMMVDSLRYEMQLGFMDVEVFWKADQN